MTVYSLFVHQYPGVYERSKTGDFYGDYTSMDKAIEAGHRFVKEDAVSYHITTMRVQP